MGLLPFKSTSEQCNLWCPRKLSCWAQGAFPQVTLLRLYYIQCMCAYLMHIDVLYFEKVLALN